MVKLRSRWIGRITLERDEFFALKIDTSGINSYFAHNLVNKHFCSSVSRRGMCGSCLTCVSYIREAFQFFGKPKSPVGLLIWRLKDQAARFVDDHHLIPISETEYGEDAFGSLLEELDNGSERSSTQTANDATGE